MKQLIVNQTEIYIVDDDKYFNFKCENRIYRDVNVKLEKNNKYILEMIAKVCELNFKGLKKIN